MNFVSFRSIQSVTSDTGSPSNRYAINDASADWSRAEAQVAQLASGGAAGKSTVVSVKSSVATAGQKRKADEEHGSSSAERGREKKASSRRSMKKAKR